MKNLTIIGTHEVYYVPSIDLNAQTGKCKISGESFLENPKLFYQEIIDWFERFKDEINKPIDLTFDLTYFDTSSSKSIRAILVLLRDFEKKGGQVTIKWHYNENDTDALIDAEDLSIESDLKFNFIKNKVI